MNSCAWISGRYLWAGPQTQSSQTASQIIHDTRNQEAGTTKNLYQYRTSNIEVQPPPYPNFPFRNGHSPRQMPNCQTSVVPHQAVSFQQTLKGNLPNSATKRQSGNPHLLVSDGFQGAYGQDFYQNSAQNSSSLHSIMKANTIYSKQGMSAHWNDSVSTNRKVGGIVSDHQSSRVQKSLSQDGLLQMVCSRTMMSATAHNGRTAYYQNRRQSSTQDRFSPSTYSTLPNIGVSQAFRNSITTGSSSSEQILPTSLNRVAGTQQGIVTQQMMIAKIADDLEKSFTAGRNYHSPFYISPQNSNASNAMPLSSVLSLPPATHSVILGAQHRVDAPHQQNSVPDDCSVKATGDGSMAANAPLPESKRGPEWNLIGSLSNTSHLCKTQSSVADNHEMLEITEKLPSVLVNDNSVHSSPARTGTSAVAVVHPLSREYYQAASKHTDADMINQLAECDAADECPRNPEKVLISTAVEKNTQDQSLQDECNFYPENPNQIRSNKSVKSHSQVSNDCPFLSSSDSTMHQDLSQKQLNADDAGSKLASTMQVYTPSVASTAQQCATSEMIGSKNATDPKPLDFELSSVPTIPWTTAMLMKLIQDEETAQMSLEGKFTAFEPISMLLVKFWNDNGESLVCKLKTGWYRDLITDVREYCDKHITSSSVILSQVNDCFQKQLQYYHVLKDDEVYSEPPYKSSWLNINKQLDLIEKEFGFQYPLKRHLHTLDSDDDPHHIKTGNSKPEQIVSEVSNKVLSLTDLKLADSGEDEQGSTVETLFHCSGQSASPDKTSADFSDPFYSFNIQVLPPEEAKVIFQQAQSVMPQSVGTDSQPERVTNSSMEGKLPEVIDLTVRDCEWENRSLHAVEKICCISKWVEIILRSETPGTKCQCTDEQNHIQDSTDKTPGKEEKEIQKKDKLCAIRPNGKFHSAQEGKNQELKIGENLNSQSLAFSPTTGFTEDDDNSSKKAKNISSIELNSSQSSIILVSENEDEDLLRNENEIPNVMPDLENDSIQPQMELTENRQPSISGSNEQETKTEIQSEAEEDDDNSSKKAKNISSIELNSSQSSIILVSENEDEDLLRNENEIPNLMPDLENDSIQPQMELTENRQPSISGSNEQETKTEIQSEAEEDQLKSTETTLSCIFVCNDKEGEEECVQALLTSTGVAESSLETEEQSKISETSPQETLSLHDTVERKRKSHDHFFPVFLKAKKCKPHVDQESLPVLEDISKCQRFFLDVTDSKPSALNVRVAKLALFGSAPKDKHASVGSRKTHISSQEGVSDGPPTPPKVLTVTTTVPTGELSVKQRIYEKWRRSLPPTKLRHRSKLKTQKGTSPSSGVSLKKAEAVGPTCTKEPSVSAEMSIWNRKPECCRCLKWRREISDGLKHGKERTKMDEATLKQHANRETNKDENGSDAVMSCQENSVLRFSVLPNTLNFKDGSKGSEDTSDLVSKETGDLVPDKSNFLKGKDKSPSKTAMKARDPERKYHPLHSPATPKTSTLSYKFQKKCMEKKQPPMDE